MKLWIALLACWLWVAPAWAQLVTTSAKHAAIMDYETGQVLWEKDGRVPMPPASMSKLMTSYMVFEKLKNDELKLTDKLLVSENAWRKGGSKMFVRVGDTVPVEDLLKGVIIQSGNDACIVLAEGLSGSEESFAAAMTRKAKDIGLENSTFANATGWPDPNHKMSAVDLVKLARLIVKDHPESLIYYAQTSFTYNGIKQGNRNPLLGTFPGADGLKTGHTEESGYGLVGTAERDGQRRIIAFNGTTSMQERADEARSLLTQAFFDFEMVPLFTEGEVVGAAKVLKGKSPEVNLIAPKDLKFGVHKAARKSLKAEVVYQGPLKPGFKKGDVIAQLVVSAEGRAPETFDLVAAEGVKKAGLFGTIGAGWGRIFGGQ